MSKQPEKQKGDPDTTGHVWDGIEEFNNPLPRWWLWTFYATIVWAVIYTIAYPAWPLVNSATAGILGYSTRAEVAKDIAAVEEANSAINTKLASVELAAIAEDGELAAYAVSAGGAVFRTWCAQCHGSGAGRRRRPVFRDACLWPRRNPRSRRHRRRRELCHVALGHGTGCIQGCRRSGCL